MFGFQHEHMRHRRCDSRRRLGVTLKLPRNARIVAISSFHRISRKRRRRTAAGRTSATKSRPVGKKRRLRGREEEGRGEEGRRPLRERDDREEKTTETKKRMLMRQIDLLHRAKILPALAAGTPFLVLSVSPAESVTIATINNIITS